MNFRGVAGILLLLASTVFAQPVRIQPWSDDSDRPERRSAPRRETPRPSPASPSTRIAPGGQEAPGPPRRHSAIVRDEELMQDIERRRRVEIVPNREYWNEVEDRKYVHYYDRRLHWYGFYHGSHLYWTTHYGGHWWWRDPYHDRWLFWHAGHWWWPAPAGVVYVYVNNAYVPYEEANVRAPRPPSVTPPPGEAGGSWESPDGRRLVEVYGPKSDAFLYDNTTDPPTFMKHLASGVEKIRFSGGKNAKPLRILLDKEGNTFTLLDAEGEPAAD